MIRNDIHRILVGLASLPPLPWLVTSISKLRNAGAKSRMLEIGPGKKRILGFETLNIVPGIDVDYVTDAAKRLPFHDNTFDLIYASHILEHIPWYKALDALKDWVRTLKYGGVLEVWVPDALKICSVLVRFECDNINEIELDGWYKFNEDRDPCLWAAGRIFTYGDGSGRLNHPNWHRSLYTPRYLMRLLENAGLSNVRLMDRGEVRGYDHGWINLGVQGTKL